MQDKLGKIINFDNYVGEIQTINQKYLFLDKDLIDKIKVGDIVTFHGEKILDNYKAFFIRKIDLSAQK